jgi:hypothetical protein
MGNDYYLAQKVVALSADNVKYYQNFTAVSALSVDIGM